ncbi:hypothetical protein ACFWPV_28350 [Streptomyces uncialis]|uniref:hypothetical protein n=1 Tax=Streptomyces uncialis TaxID=1048205 RepID=UPI0036592475
MRDSIARALVWVLSILPGTRRTRPGRHSAEHFDNQPAPAPLIICAPRTLVPVHVLVRSAPTPWAPRIAPHIREWISVQEERERQRERRAAAAAATRGVDIPFTFDGSNVTRVGVSA